MKQFLRHISFLLALFMATANAWAQLPYNTVMTQSHYNNSSIVIKTEGNVGWKDGVRLGNATGGGFNYDDKYVDIALNTNGIPNVLSATTNGGSTGIDYRVYVSSDNKTYTELWKSVQKENSISETLPKDTKYIRLLYSGNFAGYFKNIKVTELKYLNSPSSMNLRVGQKILNSTPSTNTITIDWCNVPAISYSIEEGTHKDKFSVTKIENNSSVGKYGTATIHLSYIHDDFAGEDQPHTATLKLWSNGTTYDVTLTGVTDRYIADFNWNIANVNANSGEYHVGDSVTITDAYTLKNKTTENAISLPVTFTIKTISRSSIYQEDGDGNYDNDVLSIESGVLKAKNAGVAKITASFAGNEEYKPFTKELTLTIKKHDLKAFIVQSTAVWNERINNPFYLTDELLDFTVGKSSDENVAKYDASTKNIQTYYTDGVASFQITCPEDYKYNALDQTLTLEVRSDTEKCYLISGQSVTVNHETGKNSSGVYSSDFSLNGVGGVLTFKYKLNNDADVEHYITPQYSTTDNESDFTDIPNSKITTKSDSEQQSGEIIIPEGTKRIRFKRTAQTIGTKNFSIYNIYVSRKKDLSPQIDGDIFYLTQVASGMQFAGTFPLEWSTCCDNIRFSCDNPNFVIKALDSNNQLLDYIDASNAQGTTNIIITYSANTNNPDLTGTLTIYDQSQSKTITLSCEQLLQTIDWPQYFYNIEADENGNINEDFTLNAVARTVNGQPTNRPIHYTLDVAPADKAHLSTDANGITHLIITGVCEGFITASVDEFTDEKGKRYTASQLTRDIRVRKAGEPCNTLALRVFDQYSTHGWGTNYIVFPIGDLPKDTMTFGAHAEVGSINNWLDINFHMDANAAPNASGWTEKQRIWINAAAEYTWGYKVIVPENAKQVRFEAGSSMTTYINMVRIYQQEYLRANVKRIELPSAIVNQQFSTTFEVDYSAVPFIQYTVTNNNNLNLQLIPSPEITNNCSDYGTYTFTLKGMSPYPQTNVEELITIFTSAGHKVEIPVVITSRLSDTYYFNQQPGNWGDLNNWRVNKETTPSKLPTASNPVVITKPMIINEGELVAYSVAIKDDGSVNIQPTGGLTLHAGGFTEGVTKDNFTIVNNQDGVGYVRVSPYFTREVEGTMPNITVQYTTRAKAGGAKDQVWQYVGAPGDNMQMSNNGVVVYHWSETGGWLYSDTQMTPFAGYALTRTAAGSETYNISAQPINRDHTIDLTYTANGMRGGNLFVNSYLAPIDVTKFDETNDFEGDIEKTFYLFNSGSWQQWQDQGGSNNTMKENGSSSGQYYAIAPFSAEFTASEEQKVIPPMQGVYVVASGNAKIHLKYNKHVFKSTSSDKNRPMRAPQENENFMRVRLQVNSQNSGADRMYIIQHENTTRGYDNGYDAKNILAQGQANIYTNEPEGQMEISVADQIDSTFIGFAAGEDSKYTLTFTSLVGQDMYIHDLEADSLFLLTEEGQYTFSASPNTVNDLRFQLLLHPDLPEDENGNGVTTDVDNILSSAQLWVNEKRVYIASAPQNSTLSVFSISGMPVTSPLTIHHAPCTIDLSHLPTGVYVLRLNDQALKFVCK